MFTVDLTRPGVIEIPDVLSSAECAQLIARIEQLGPSKATINTAQGAGVQPQVRNNERVIFADEELAQRLFEKARPHAPQEMRQRELVGAE